MSYNAMLRSDNVIRNHEGAKANVAMTNFTYNIARLTQIYRYHKEWITM